MKEDICARLVPVFKNLDQESLAKISDITKCRHFEKGDTVFSPYLKVGLIIISSGELKEYQLAESGKEQLLRLLGPGDFLGEYSLFGNDDPATFGEALTPLDVCIVRQDDFIKLLTSQPSIGIKLLEQYSKRLKATDNLVTNATTESVPKRLASYLRELSKESKSNNVLLPMSMKDLATFLGTTPETLSRCVRRLEDEGILAKEKRQFHILKPHGLEEIQ